MDGKFKINFLFVFFIFLLNFTTYSIASSFNDLPKTSPFTPNELNTIRQYLFNNIATTNHPIIQNDMNNVIHSLNGAVLASPSNHGKDFSQDYQFHWTRDAAITMKEVVQLYLQASANEKKQLKPYLLNYISFEYKAQKQISKSGEKTLGQPKYNLDATIWDGKWARPQNDSPALRAITMINIMNVFQSENTKYPRETLLEMIATDLNYVMTEWQRPSFDLWEEMKDREHFFTKIVQRKALLDGSNLMRTLGKKQQADQYLRIAQLITKSLQKHWNTNLGYYSETLKQQDYKGGGMNSAILLGVLYADREDAKDFFAPNNDKVLSSIYFMRNAFSGLYKIDISHSIPMIGRYPSDVYDGNKFLYGNPWILTTNALAHYYYLLARIYLKQGQISITKNNILFFQQINPNLVQKEENISLSTQQDKFYKIINSLVKEGDAILNIVKQYSICYPDQSCYHFSEQIDRASGKQVSAKDLTWGYTTLLSAMRIRASLMQ